MDKKMLELLKSVGSKRHQNACERRAGVMECDKKGYVRHPKHKGKEEKENHNA